MLINIQFTMFEYLPRDTHVEIIKHLKIRAKWPDVRTLGRLACTNKYFNALINVNSTESMFIVDPREKLRRARIQQLRRQDRIWDHRDERMQHILCPAATDHESVTFDTLLHYHTIMCNICSIPANPNISIEMLLELIEHYNVHTDQIDFRLSKKSIITPEELEQHGLQIDIDRSLQVFTFADYIRNKTINFKSFMQTGRIKPSDVIENPSLKWSPHHLLRNDNMSTEFVLKHFNMQIHEYVAATSILIKGETNRKYEIDILIKAYFDVNSTKQLRQNIVNKLGCNADIETVKNNPNIAWSWMCVSESEYITPRDMIMNNHLPFIWWRPHMAVLLPMDATKDHPWLEYQRMADRGELTESVIESSPHVKWDWIYLCNLESLSITYILSKIIKKSPIDRRITVGRRADCTHEFMLNYVGSFRNRIISSYFTA